MRVSLMEYPDLTSETHCLPRMVMDGERHRRRPVLPDPTLGPKCIFGEVPRAPGLDMQRRVKWSAPKISSFWEGL